MGISQLKLLKYAGILQINYVFEIKNWEKLHRSEP